MGRPSRSGARSGHRHARAGSFGRLLTRGTVAPRRRGKTAGGPIGRAHVVLPGQPVTACQEIPHIGSLNWSTQHFILNGKDGVCDESKISSRFQCVGENGVMGSLAAWEVAESDWASVW